MIEPARSAHDEALSLIGRGTARHEVLAYLTGAAERLGQPGSVASILVVDKSGLLRNGASPKLPPDYLMAIDGLKPDADVGTCAAAAATGQVVVTPDFKEDGKWNELRHLPLALGFAGAWSTPITDDGGRVLGTFGIYQREVREPSAEEREAIAILARAAAQAIRTAS